MKEKEKEKDDDLEFLVDKLLFEEDFIPFEDRIKLREMREMQDFGICGICEA
jgi:hypothetical protein